VYNAQGGLTIDWKPQGYSPENGRKNVLQKKRDGQKFKQGKKGRFKHGTLTCGVAEKPSRGGPYSNPFEKRKSGEGMQGSYGRPGKGQMRVSGSKSLDSFMEAVKGQAPLEEGRGR